MTMGTSVRERSKQGAESNEDDKIECDKDGEEVTPSVIIHPFRCRIGNSEEPFSQQVVQLIDQESDNRTHHHPAHNIGDKMDAEIDSGIAVQRCPEESGEGRPPISIHKSEKGCQCEAIGSVTGDKAVQAAPVIIHDIDQILEIGMMRRPQPLEDRFKNGRGDLIARHQEQDEEEGYKKGFFARFLIKEKEKDEEKERYPDETTADGPHRLI